MPTETKWRSGAAIDDGVGLPELVYILKSGSCRYKSLLSISCMPLFCHYVVLFLIITMNIKRAEFYNSMW